MSESPRKERGEEDLKLRTEHQRDPGPGWRTVLGAAALYGAILGAIGHRVFARFGEVLPAKLADPLQHLWILRWYQSCLASGHSPFLAPDVMFPVGAPLGLFSPLHLQALIWNLVAWAIPGDLARYNLLWTFGFLFTAAGGFFLSWRLLRDRTAAVFGGLLCLLATPVTIHAYGHLELIYIGALGFFLLGWTEFVDRPRGRSFVVALGTYGLVSACAAYFAVMATIPAALFVVWSGVRAAGAGFRVWWRARIGWLVAFSGVAVVGLAILFASQIWVRLHGFQAQRGRIEFTQYWAPLWSYFMPTELQRAEPLLPWHPYRTAEFGESAIERSSYLGIVPLALIAYAAARRVRFRHAGYYWAAFALSIVLSLGAYRWIHEQVIWLPADWLWRIFPPMRDLRVPARFNLFAAVLASLLAASGLASLLRTIERTRLRQLLIVGLFAATILDLAPPAYPGIEPPAIPDLYRRIVARDPRATFHEAPFFGTRGFFLPAATAYWQYAHGGKTSGGYSGVMNAELESRVGFPSPFFARNLSYDGYLADPAHQMFDVVRADAADYLWAFFHRNGFRYAVVYTDPNYFLDLKGTVDPLLPLLAPAEIERDSMAIAYAADRLPPPRRPVLVPLEGLHSRQMWDGHWAARVGKLATFALYNPTPQRPLVLRLGAESFGASRSVRVILGARDIVGAGGVKRPGKDLTLIRLRANPDTFRWFDSGEIRLRGGWSEVRIESFGETPQDPERAQWGSDQRPISIFIAAIEAYPADEPPSRPMSRQPPEAEEEWFQPPGRQPHSGRRR